MTTTNDNETIKTANWILNQNQLSISDDNLLTNENNLIHSMVPSTSFCIPTTKSNRRPSLNPQFSQSTSSNILINNRF